MKDAYSFHTDDDDFQKTYEEVDAVYRRIFEAFGVPFVRVEADGGDIGDGRSHEFHVLSNVGEDTLLHCSVGEYSANVEVARAVDGDACPCESCSCDRRGVLMERKGIEVGHIFHLGTKYSSAMGATYQARDGSRVPISMGCYGIGITRVVAAIIEAGCEAFGEDAFVWPDAVAPYECLLLPPQSSKDKETPEADAMRAAYESMPDKSRIVFDDRFDTSKRSSWKKFRSWVIPLSHAATEVV